MVEKQKIFVVEDDPAIRDVTKMMLEHAGYKARVFGSAEEFLDDAEEKAGCAILDIRLPDMSGLELQRRLASAHGDLKVVIVTGLADIPTVLEAMRSGAVDLLEKPYTGEQLLASVRRALDASGEARLARAEIKHAQEKLAILTPRERDVLDKIAGGCSNKVAAHELRISPRTVETHRANIMQKLNASGLHELVRIIHAAKKAGPNAATSVTEPSGSVA